MISVQLVDVLDLAYTLISDVLPSGSGSAGPCEAAQEPEGPQRTGSRDTLQPWRSSNVKENRDNWRFLHKNQLVPVCQCGKESKTTVSKPEITHNSLLHETF